MNKVLRILVPMALFFSMVLLPVQADETSWCSHIFEEETDETVTYSLNNLVKAGETVHIDVQCHASTGSGIYYSFYGVHPGSAFGLTSQVYLTGTVAGGQSFVQDYTALYDGYYSIYLTSNDYTDSAFHFGGLVEAQAGFVAGRIPLVPGIGVSASSSSLSPDQAIYQASLTRSLGAQGFILFNLGAGLAEWHLPAFALGFTSPMGQALEMH